MINKTLNNYQKIQNIHTEIMKKKTVLILLLLSAILNILIGFKYAKKMYWEYFERKPFIVYRYERDKLFEVLPTESTDIIFLGNSITQTFELYELLKDLRVRNRGVGGETTLGALNRLKTITNGKPAQIFIELGINDLNTNVEDSETLKNYEEIIKQIQRESPSTEIIIESVLPVSKFNEELISCKNANIKIIKLNQDLEKLANKSNVKYLDLYSLFIDGQGMNQNLTIDGVHLNGVGYLKLASMIKTNLIK